MPLFALLGAVVLAGAALISPDAVVARQFAIYGSVLIGGSALLDVLVGDPRFGRQGAPRHALDDVGRDLVERHQRRPQHDLHVRLPLGDLRHRAVDGARTVRRARVRAAQGRRARSRAQGLAAGALRAGLDPHPYRAILALALPAAITYALMATESAAS